MAEQSQSTTGEAGGGTPPGGESQGGSTAPAGEAGTTSGDTGGGKAESDATQLRAQLTEQANEIKSLKDQIRGLSKERSGATSKVKTLEERVAELEQSRDTAVKEKDALARSNRIRDGIESAIEGVPEGKRKTARAIAAGLAGDLELGAEDNAAAIESLKKSLKDDHADVLGEVQRKTTPHVPAPANGTPTNTSAQGIRNSRGEPLM